jgi:hypothetical protein
MQFMNRKMLSTVHMQYVNNRTVETGKQQKKKKEKEKEKAAPLFTVEKLSTVHVNSGE